MSFSSVVLTQPAPATFIFEFGGYRFSISPVSVLKCELVHSVSWVRGASQELAEFERLRHGLIPYLLSVANTVETEAFVEQVLQRAGAVVEGEGLDSPLVETFVRELNATLRDGDAVIRATAIASHFGELTRQWLAGPFGELACEAALRLQSYGVTPLCPGLGTAENMGGRAYGQFIPSLRTVSVQLDLVAQEESPELKLIDVLLHEQVHALIDLNLDCDQGNRRMEWLHELAAIGTSHHAIVQAAEQLTFWDEIEENLALLKSRERFGKLFSDTLKSNRDPLLAWKVWQDIFALPAEEKANYFLPEIHQAILWERGWNNPARQRRLGRIRRRRSRGGR